MLKLSIAWQSYIEIYAQDDLEDFNELRGPGHAYGQVGEVAIRRGYLWLYRRVPNLHIYGWPSLHNTT